MLSKLRKVNKKNYIKHKKYYIILYNKQYKSVFIDVFWLFRKKGRKEKIGKKA